MVALFYIGYLVSLTWHLGKKTFSTFKNSQFSDQLEMYRVVSFSGSHWSSFKVGLVSMAV